MRKYPIHDSALKEEAVTSVRAAEYEPDEAAIATLAYRLWSERGKPEGSSEEDWYRAKELLRAGKAVIASSSLP